MYFFFFFLVLFIFNFNSSSFKSQIELLIFFENVHYKGIYDFNNKNHVSYSEISRVKFFFFAEKVKLIY